MSSKLNLGIRCYAYMRGGTIWGMLTELKVDIMSFAGNTVWSVSEYSETQLYLLVELYKFSPLTFNFNLVCHHVTINLCKLEHRLTEMMLRMTTCLIDMIQPDNTMLKDYGRLLKDGELKIRAHSDNRTKTRSAVIWHSGRLLEQADGSMSATLITCCAAVIKVQWDVPQPPICSSEARFSENLKIISGILCDLCRAQDTFAPMLVRVAPESTSGQNLAFFSKSGKSPAPGKIPPEPDAIAGC